MVKRSCEYVLNKAKKAEKVVIVGAGEKGKELYFFLKECGATVDFFFDNSLLSGKIDGVSVLKPEKIESAEAVYIISVCNRTVRKELHKQLEELGVESSQIIIYYAYKDYDYFGNLNEKYYQEELSEIYRERIGKDINWEHPQTYTEIINWEKLYERDERKTMLADKYLVRDWVKGKIGEQYLTKHYGVWDNANDIDFDSLPQKFVLKTNHMSGSNIIVKSKDEIDQDNVRKQLNDWLAENYTYNASLQWHYGGIIPKIICEEYLEGVAETVYDYNIYCFQGEPEYIWCIKGSHRPECQASFYDKDWNMQEFYFGYPLDPIEAPRPEKLNEMLELSRILCKDFKHVRVDWYNLPDGRVLFGEMTFTSWGGLQKFVPEKWDKIFGDLIGNVKRND